MQFTYMLAPLEDITGNAFRSICHKYGADLTFTPMARIESLAKKNASTLSKIEIKDNTPTQIQVIGAREMHFGKFLKDFKPENGFKGFNFNIGCPSPQVIRIGQGCAMIKRISKTKKIVSVFRDHGYKISIKMRLGLNKFEKERKVYLNLIDAVDADFFIVHARYGQQTYAEPADFKVYESCVKTGRNIIANGDIRTVEQIQFLKEIGVKGAMLGRSAVVDPSIFNKLKGLVTPDADIIIKECVELSKRYNEPFKYQKNVIKHSGASG